MPVRRPLVQVGGQVQELPAGDTLAGTESLLSAARQFAASSDCVTNTATPEFAGQVAGTGAALTSVAPATAGLVGVLRGASGTTATGRAAIASPTMTVMRFGGGEARFGALLSVPTLSTAAETYTLRVGFLDNVAGEATDGAFIRYSHGVNGGALAGRHAQQRGRDCRGYRGDGGGR